MEDRPPLPSSSMSIVIAARPSLPDGSSAAPRRTSSEIVTTGTDGWQTVHTRRPLARVDFSIVGNVNDRVKPGSGSRERSITVALTRLSRDYGRDGARQGQFRPAPRHHAEDDAPIVC